jgi:hypothetical protein
MSLQEYGGRALNQNMAKKSRVLTNMGCAALFCKTIKWHRVKDESISWQYPKYQKLVPQTNWTNIIGGTSRFRRI